MDNTNDSQIAYVELTKKQRAIIIMHGLIVIVIGSLAGFAWVISIAGYLELWPIPNIDFSLPNNKELWRNAHLGPISHGMLVMIIAAISPLLKLTKKESLILVYACLTEIWFNVLGFQSAPFTENRGLTTTGSFIDLFSYCTFYIAIVASCVILYLSIKGCYRTILAEKR